MKNRRKTHKTCPSWDTTQCMKTIKGVFLYTSYRWRDVTCKNCLKGNLSKKYK